MSMCNTGQVGVGVYPDMGVNPCGYGICLYIMQALYAQGMHIKYMQ